MRSTHGAGAQKGTTKRSKHKRRSLHHPPQRHRQRTTRGAPAAAHPRLLDPHIRLAPRGLTHGHRPRRESVVHADVVDEPAAKGAAVVALGRLEQHEFALELRGGGIVVVARLAVAPHEDDFLVLAVRICGEPCGERGVRAVLPRAHEPAHFAFQVHQQAFGAAAALELLAQLFGHDAGRCGRRGHGARGVLGGNGRGVACGGLALEAGVPERREVVGHVAHAVGGVDFPVVGRWGFDVGVVEEAVWEVQFEDFEGRHCAKGP